MDYSKEQYYKMQQMLANQAYGAGEYGEKQPFYKTYPLQSLYMTELEYEKDMERMKELYPLEAKKILEYVEDECDRMEYDGSMMFDEFPDRLMLRRICDRIYSKVVGDDIAAKPVDTGDKMDLDVEAQQRGRRDDGRWRDDGRRREDDRRRDNRGRRDDGVRNLIEVLLYNEMYKRRCRYKRCRRWW